MVLKDELKRLRIPYSMLKLGFVEVSDTVTVIQLEKLENALLKSGLELMKDKKAMLIEKIKNVIIEMIHYSDEIPKVNYSDYISEKLGQDYTHISKIFSEVKGITIEHYIIAHKIERVKELLLYDELSLTQISYVLNYSSVSHLSQQFKKVTGVSPRFFKQINEQKRISLEDV